MHKKKYGDWHQPEDVTPSENVLMGIWIPENYRILWDRLSSDETQRIGRDITYYICKKIAQAVPKNEELLRLGD